MAASSGAEGDADCRHHIDLGGSHSDAVAESFDELGGHPSGIVDTRAAVDHDGKLDTSCPRDEVRATHRRPEPSGGFLHHPVEGALRWATDPVGCRSDIDEKQRHESDALGPSMNDVDQVLAQCMAPHEPGELIEVPEAG